MSARRKRTHKRAAAQVSSPASPWWLRAPALAVTLVICAGTAAVRLRLAGVPLERDEGEYAYAGQLILQGIPTYHLAYNMKFPGTYYAYSLFLAVFGQTPSGIHTGLLLMNLATAVVLFFVGRRLLGEFGGAIAASTFAVMSLDRWILGVFAHATHFVLLPTLLALLLLLRAVDTRRAAGFVGAGVLLGIAVLMKQQAIFLLLFGMAFALAGVRANEGKWAPALKHTALVAAGAVVVFAVLCGVLAQQGVLQRFWFWTFQYASAYVAEVPLWDAWSPLVFAWNVITQANLPIWSFGAFGAAILWLGRWSAQARLFVTGLLLASFLAVCPGFYFREHYFILLLPAAGLCAGVGAVWIERLLARRVSAPLARAGALLVVLAAIAAYVANEGTYLFSMDTRELSRSRYGGNPFVEAPEIARHIQQQTGPDDPVAVLGSEPEIYFYAQRKSATGYIYTYALMEPQPYAARMQAEMIREITAMHPKYLVFAAVATSWQTRRTSDTTILRWADRYTDTCYEVVGLADIYSPAQSAVLWYAELTGYQPRSKNLIYTFVRKSDAPCAVAP